jgi:1-deoxy-D-xylulose-5-phosphate synthase
LNEIALQNILYTAQLGLEQPIAIRYPRGRVISDWQSQHFGKYEKIKIGTAQCLKKGTETAVLSNGHLGKMSLWL